MQFTYMVLNMMHFFASELDFIMIQSLDMYSYSKAKNLVKEKCYSSYYILPLRHVMEYGFNEVIMIGMRVMNL